MSSLQSLLFGLVSIVLVAPAQAAPQEPPIVDPCTGQGCTPGYWKNHPERWDGVDGDDYTATIHTFLSFNTVMGVTMSESGFSDDVTLLEAAGTAGGGVNALNRHAAAALASSDAQANPDQTVCYGLTTQQVIDLYRDAVGAEMGPEDIDSAHSTLEENNEMGCPLNNSPPGGPTDSFCFGNMGDCPCGNESAEGGCANSTGFGAVLDVEGEACVSTDDLLFHVSGTPVQNFGILFMGSSQVRFPFKDGVLCVGAGFTGLFRYPPAASDANGNLTLGPGLVGIACGSAQPLVCVQPGDTRFYQFWYRDAFLALTCGNKSNLTNGVAVQFTL